MGYISTVEGQLYITDIEKNRPNGGMVYDDLQQALNRRKELHWVIDVAENGLGYTVLYDGSGKAYTIEEDVQKVVDYFKNDGYAVEGEIRIIGEESPDFSRVIVRDGVAVLEKATVTISFPDGSTWD